MPATDHRLWRGRPRQSLVFFSKGLQHAVTGGSDWAACETPCFLNAGERPDLVKLNVVCAGTVLVKGIELLQTPLK